MSPASPHHGIAISAATSGTAITAKMRLAFVPRSTRTESMSVPRPRKQSARADDQDGEKGEVSGQYLPIRIELRADRLGDAKHDAPDQRTPHAAEPADNDGFECEDQPDRSRQRREDRSDAEQHTRERREYHRDSQRRRVELAIIDAHQFGGVGIVGDGAKGAAKPRAIKQQLQAGDGQYGDRQHDDRKDTDIDAVRKVHACGLDRAYLEPVIVGAEALQQSVLDDDRNAERDQERRQQAAAESLIQ